MMTLLEVILMVALIAVLTKSKKEGPEPVQHDDQLKELSDKVDAIMHRLDTSVEALKASKAEDLKEKLRQVLEAEDLHGARELTIQRLQEASGCSYEECADVVKNSGLWSPFDLEVDRYLCGENQLSQPC